MLEFVPLVIQMAVGVAFALASVSKILAFSKFERGIASFGFTRASLVRPVAVLVVALELGIGASFIFRQYVEVFSGTAVLLVGVFATATVTARIRRLHTNCFCFGGGVEATSFAGAFRLGFLAAGTVVGYFWRDVSVVASARWPTVDEVAASVAVVLVVAWIVRILDATIVDGPLQIGGRRSK